MKKLLLFLLTANQLLSQDKLGYINSEYAGISSIYSNPTNFLNSKIFIDINIIGANAFIANNLVYYPKSTSSVLKNNFSNPGQNLKDVTKRGFAEFNVEGPSAGVSFDNYSFGFFINGRSMAEAKVSKTLASYVLKTKDQSYFNENGIQNQRAFFGFGAWTEFGLNAAYMYRRNHYSFRNVGVNLKYLVGIANASFRVNDADYDISNTGDLENVHAIISYKYNIPQWNAGKGIALDLGWSYTRMLEAVSNYSPNNKKISGCKHISYKYKLGASITDLGFINYKKNASSKKIEYDSGSINLDSTKANSFESIDQELSRVGNGLKTSSKNHFLAVMPIGINVQYDYNFENNFFINSSISVGPRIVGQLKRPDLLSITPRYDRKYFGAALPISLYNWTYPQVGFALRFGTNFIIGTDRAGYIFGIVRNTYGANIYFNLKIALFTHCGQRKRRMKSTNDCISKDQPLLKNK
jgi:hypothetical protein